MRCPNCGNQASWRDPNCNKCDTVLHHKTCKGKSSSCSCHDINEKTWSKKKLSKVLRINGRKKIEIS